MAKDDNYPDDSREAQDREGEERGIDGIADDYGEKRKMKRRDKMRRMEGRRK